MRTRALGLLAAFAVLLAGCGGIPSSGSVERGQIIDEEALIDVGFRPTGPQAGATQLDILQGFIDAATNPQNDYEVARLFLTDTADWDPNATTQIRTGVGVARAESDTVYSYSLTSSAHVDERGQYFEDESATQTLLFSFAQNADGEWRISDAPDGIVLSSESFRSIFEAHPLYFFDPSSAFLIPDLRWFPRTARLSTRVVSALLAGPSAWLQQGVTTTYFPSGTRLESSVTITGGVATVALSDEAIAATGDQLQRMRQQLRDSIGTVSSVVVTVNDVALEDAAVVAPATINPGVESQLLVAQADAVGFLGSSGSVSRLGAQAPAILGLGATDFTLSRDNSRSAVLAPDGAYLVTSNGREPLRLDTRADLLTPSVDNAGFVWTMPASDASAIHAYDNEGTQYLINAPQLAGMRAVSFSIARDGARLLVLAETDFGPRLSVAGIVRSDGVPTHLGPLLSFSLDQDSRPLDASWVDDNSVSTLTVAADDTASTVTLYELGGPSEAIGSVVDGVSVVGGNGGVDGLRVVTSDGQVYRPRGNGWADTGISLRFIATQQ